MKTEDTTPTEELEIEEAMNGSTESPRSSNIRGYYKGYSIQLTLRDPEQKVFPLLKKMIKIADWMDENGFNPSWNTKTNREQDPDEGVGESKPEMSRQVCAVHDEKMSKFEKEGKSWYSHTDGSRWCSGNGWKD